MISQDALNIVMIVMVVSLPLQAFSLTLWGFPTSMMAQLMTASISAFVTEGLVVTLRLSEESRLILQNTGIPIALPVSLRPLHLSPLRSRRGSQAASLLKCQADSQAASHRKCQADSQAASHRGSQAAIHRKCQADSQATSRLGSQAASRRKCRADSRAAIPRKCRAASRRKYHLLSPLLSQADSQAASPQSNPPVGPQNLPVLNHPAPPPWPPQIPPRCTYSTPTGLQEAWDVRTMGRNVPTCRRTQVII